MTDISVHGAQQAGRSRTARRVVLAGWAAKGVVYLALAWIVLQLAFGRPPAEASSQGAVEWIARSGPGVVAIVLLGLGLLAYAVGRVLEVTALAGPDIDTVDRVQAGVLTVLYVGLAVTAFGVLGRGGSGGGGGQQAGSSTAMVLGWPGGRWIVGAIAVAVLAFAVWSVVEGVRQRFLGTLRTGEMSPGLRQAVTRIGTAAYVTRGLVFALVGWFLLQAALTFDPSRAKGLDGSLRAVADAPWGRLVLSAVALGLLCYGAFCLFESRYRRIGSSATGTT